MIKHQISCDSCHEGNLEPYVTEIHGLDEKEYDFYQCTNCSLITVYPPPSAEYLINFYSKNYRGRVKTNISSGDNVFRSNKAAIEDCYTKLSYIEKYHKIKSGNLLDIGCGNGFFLYAAQNKGYSVTGVDIDEEAILFGKKFFGIPIINNEITDFRPLGN